MIGAVSSTPRVRKRKHVFAAANHDWCASHVLQVASRQGDALCADCLWEVTHAKVSCAVHNSEQSGELVEWAHGCINSTAGNSPHALLCRFAMRFATAK